MIERIEKERDTKANEVIWSNFQDDLAKFAPKTTREQVLIRADYYSMYLAGFNFCYKLMKGAITWTPGEKLDDLNKRVLLAAYEHTGRNKTKTAKMLGLSIRHVREKIADGGNVKYLSDTDKAMIKVMLKRGYPVTTIAKLMLCAPSTVYRVRWKNDDRRY